MPNPTSATIPPAPRLYGIDLVRFFSFAAILMFHLSYAFWGVDGHLDGSAGGLPIIPFNLYARAMAFSGFSIIAISFFLFGFKPSAKWKYLWLYLLAFLAIWTYTTEDIPDAWDIYQFLIVAFLAIRAVQALKIPPAIVAFVSFIIVSVPFWKFEGLWRSPVEPVLWGRCLGPTPSADWPLLPWLAYPLLSYAIGRLARENLKDLMSLRRAEILVWALALLASLPFLGGYFRTAIGPGFACYVFRREALEFWAPQLWVWFFVRLSLGASIQARLNSCKSVRFISGLQVNRRFFLVYFLHYPLVFWAGRLAHQNGLAYWPWAYTISFFTIVVLLEALPVVIGRISAKIKF